MIIYFHLEAVCPLFYIDFNVDLSKHIGTADFLVKNLEHPDPLEGQCPESNDQTKLFHRESVGGKKPANHQPQLVIAGLLEINSLRLHQQYLFRHFQKAPDFLLLFVMGIRKIYIGCIRKVPTGPRCSRVHMFSTSLAAACLERPKLSEVCLRGGKDGDPNWLGLPN